MSKTRVLIVDDDVNLSRLSAMILENSGAYEVITEQDSRRALAVARQFRPEIMVLDVDMPHKVAVTWREKLPVIRYSGRFLSFFSPGS